MERFKALKFRPIPEIEGIAAAMEFPNGYAASVICGEYSYGGPQGLYELAVVDNVNGGIAYDTPITDDVLGYLSEADVDRVLGQIMDLPPAEKRNAN